MKKEICSNCDQPSSGLYQDLECEHCGFGGFGFEYDDWDDDMILSVIEEDDDYGI